MLLSSCSVLFVSTSLLWMCIPLCDPIGQNIQRVCLYVCVCASVRDLPYPSLPSLFSPVGVIHRSWDCKYTKLDPRAINQSEPPELLHGQITRDGHDTPAVINNSTYSKLTKKNRNKDCINTISTVTTIRNSVTTTALYCNPTLSNKLFPE